MRAPHFGKKLPDKKSGRLPMRRPLFSVQEDSVLAGAATQEDELHPFVPVAVHEASQRAPVGANAERALASVAGKYSAAPVEASFEASAQAQAALMLTQAVEGVPPECAAKRVFVEATGEAIEETHVERDVACLHATPAAPVVVAIAAVAVSVIAVVLVIVAVLVVAGITQAEAFLDAPLAPVDGVALSVPAELGPAPALAPFAAPALFIVVVRPCVAAAISPPPSALAVVAVRIAVPAAPVFASFLAVLVFLASLSLLPLCALGSEKKQQQSDEGKLSASHGITGHVIRKNGVVEASR
jgi:hypothetical protein